jgi:hypothetical protein
MSARMRKAVVAIALLVSPVWAQNALLPDGTITCASPVAPSDSAKSLMQRYGQEAVIQDDLSTGVEDITYKGVVLLPQAADWRIEVSFTDETMGRVAGLILRSSTKTSHWNVAGVTLGSSLPEVQKINGKPFLLSGFEWDYSGFVTNWNGGKFGRPLPGGCKLILRFDKDAGVPDGMSGEGTKVSSDNAKLVKWGPVVTQIEVNFPNK